MSDTRPSHGGARGLESVGAQGSPGFVLIGHPVAHSLSPVMQQAALRALGIDATYTAFDVAPDSLPGCMRALRAAARAGRLGGANVTLPHKQNVCSFLDGLDVDADRAGAVNTVCIERLQTTGGASNVVLRGCNTDVGGLVAALGDAGVRLAGKSVLVLGSGGMARAAVVAAFRERASLVILCGRNEPSCHEILEQITTLGSGTLPRTACGSLAQAAGEFLAQSDVLIQATSLGLAEEDPSPVSLARAIPELFVFDAIYRPAETALLRQARERNLRCVNGLGFLVHQGAQALALWTGRRPPLGVMRQSVGLH